MSITAISSSVASAVREFARASVQPAVATYRSTGEPRDTGRRHDLVGAMNQVLGVRVRQGESGEEAVFTFAHALMDDLRSIEGGPAPGTPGADQGHDQVARGSGQRMWNDLPQRLDALGTAASASSRTATVAPAAVEPQPNPITANSAALHLMRVPSLHLLEAYAAMRKAVGEQATASSQATSRDDLATFIDRLSKELATDAPAVPPTGSVFNLTA